MRRVTVASNLCGPDGRQLRFPAKMNGRLPDLSAFRCRGDGYGPPPRIVQCRYCGQVFANPRWVNDELPGAYRLVECEVCAAERAGRELEIAQLAVPVKIGDLFTVYARGPESECGR